MVKLICKICGQEFQVPPRSIRRGAKYCSRKCAGIATSQRIGESAPNWQGGKIEIACASCGKKQLIKRHSVKERNFCSQKCYGKWLSQNRKGKESPNWQKVRVICPICGKEFRRTKSYVKYYKKVFCSVKCRGIWNTQSWRGDQNPNWRDKVKKLICPVCSKEFFRRVSPSQEKMNHYCSRTCNSIASKMSMPNKETGIEKQVAEILEALGVQFVKQKPMEGIKIVDFYIPEQHLIIEADGKYWHSLPGAKDRDVRQDFLLMFKGYNILRIGEELLKQNPQKARQLILKSIKK